MDTNKLSQAYWQIRNALQWIEQSGIADNDPQEYMDLCAARDTLADSIIQPNTNTPEPCQVLIIVDGGCLAGAFSTVPGAYDLYDMDNLREEHGRDEAEKLCDEEMKNYPIELKEFPRA